MLKVLYEDNHIIVVIKPHNMPSQADDSKDKDLLSEVKNYIKELTKDMNITLKYIPYSDYNKSLQNTMIYNPSKNPEIILGNFFDEEKSKYLYYLDYPIYEDYMVLVANKEFLPKDFKPVKGDLEGSLTQLLKTNNLLQITGQTFPITLDMAYKTEDIIEIAMENVFINGNFLITSYMTISDYLERNKGTQNCTQYYHYNKYVTVDFGLSFTP